MTKIACFIIIAFMTPFIFIGFISAMIYVAMRIGIDWWHDFAKIYLDIDKKKKAKVPNE